MENKSLEEQFINELGEGFYGIEKCVEIANSHAIGFAEWTNTYGWAYDDKSKVWIRDSVSCQSEILMKIYEQKTKG